MKKRVFEFFLILVLLLALTFLMYSNNPNITGNIIAQNSDYKIREVKQLSYYLWYLASVGDTLYSGMYGNPQSYYSTTNPEGNWQRTEIARGDESSRVYNLNGRFYATSEGGAIYADGNYCANLEGTYGSTSSDKDHYTLGASYYKGKYLISINPKSESYTAIYDCPCQNGVACRFWRTIPNIFTFHTEEFGEYLYLIGTSKDSSRSYRTETKGRVYRIDNQGNKATIISSGPGSGVRAEVFDNKLFIGFSYDAEIHRLSGSSTVREKSFSRIEHFGDFEVFDNRLFAIVVDEGGSPEVWYRETNANGGGWKILFTRSQLSKYGVRGNLVNAAGFFQVHKGKLYMNINNKDNSRGGPGYILEISKTCTTYEICDGTDSNCNGQIDENCSWYCDDDDQDGYLGTSQKEFTTESQAYDKLDPLETLCNEISTCTISDTFSNIPQCPNEGNPSDERNAPQADIDALTYPGATEICDGLDNNINTEIDEDCISLECEDYCDDAWTECEIPGFCGKQGTLGLKKREPGCELVEDTEFVCYNSEVYYCNQTSALDWEPNIKNAFDNQVVGSFVCDKENSRWNNECTSGWECFDNNPCTEDNCNRGICENPANGSLPSCECTIDSDCRDDNICTSETCSNRKCIYSSNPISCDDQNPCTENDFCTNQTCIGTPINVNDNNWETYDYCLENGTIIHHVFYYESQNSEEEPVSSYLQTAEDIDYQEIYKRLWSSSEKPSANDTSLIGAKDVKNKLMKISIETILTILVVLIVLGMAGILFRYKRQVIYFFKNIRPTRINTPKKYNKNFEQTNKSKDQEYFPDLTDCKHQITNQCKNKTSFQKLKRFFQSL